MRKAKVKPQIVIGIAQNGAALIINADTDEPELRVYEDTDDAKWAQNIIFDLMEKIVPNEYNNRYSRERVVVRIEHGDKWDEPNHNKKTCEVCNDQ